VFSVEDRAVEDENDADDLIRNCSACSEPMTSHALGGLAGSRRTAAVKTMLMIWQQKYAALLIMRKRP